MNALEPIGSPCTGVCRIDAVSGFCAGCRRSLDEIAAWRSLDDAARRAIWLRLPERELPVPPSRREDL